ncbi:hypothetical protein HanRHA438_Chr03g0139611 [Helianthus annuus]|nr:hypothetical protein HanRHA438_Chr03g0139611 [Helianthus annuus]
MKRFDVEETLCLINWLKPTTHFECFLEICLVVDDGEVLFGIFIWFLIDD